MDYTRIVLFVIKFVYLMIFATFIEAETRSLITYKTIVSEMHQQALSSRPYFDMNLVDKIHYHVLKAINVTLSRPSVDRLYIWSDKLYLMSNLSISSFSDDLAYGFVDKPSLIPSLSQVERHLLNPLEKNSMYTSKLLDKIALCEFYGIFNDKFNTSDLIRNNGNLLVDNRFITDIESGIKFKYDSCYKLSKFNKNQLKKFLGKQQLKFKIGPDPVLTSNSNPYYHKVDDKNDMPLKFKLLNDSVNKLDTIGNDSHLNQQNIVANILSSKNLIYNATIREGFVDKNGMKCECDCLPPSFSQNIITNFCSNEIDCFSLIDIDNEVAVFNNIHKNNVVYNSPDRLYLSVLKSAINLPILTYYPCYQKTLSME